jgi:hypothetical protein
MCFEYQIFDNGCWMIVLDDGHALVIFIEIYYALKNLLKKCVSTFLGGKALFGLFLKKSKPMVAFKICCTNNSHEAAPQLRVGEAGL